MSSFFSPDSKFMRSMSRLGDLMVLNFIFLLTCVPIFTIGAALTALYTVSFRMGTEREQGALRSYFRAFRANFRQGTVLWLILLFCVVCLGVDTFFFWRQPVPLFYLCVLFGFLLLAALLTMGYAFPLLSQFEAGTKQTLKNALVLSAGYLPRSILITALNLFPFVVLLTNLYLFLSTAFLWTFLYFSAAAYLNARLLKKVFAPYRPEEEEEIL